MKRLILPILAVPTLVFAQSSLVFDTEAPRKVWMAKSVTAPPPDVPEVSSKQVTLALDNPGPFICVLDVTTGNLATRSAVPKASGSWKVVSADFKLIGKVVVKLDQGGAPPDHAAVSLTETKLVDPAAKGTATFYGVKPGDVEVVVSYKSGGEMVSKSQKFELDLKRDEPEPTLIVALSGKAPVTTPGKPDKIPATPGGAGIVGNVLLVLLVAAGAIAFLVFGLKWIYSNQDKAKDALGKLGVQVPDPIQPDPGTPPPVAVQQDAITPIVLPDATVAPSSPAPLSQSLRLVGASGTFELLEGVHVVGREAGLTISLVGESTVSRRHAEIVNTGGRILVRDEGSTNGTFINGVKVVGEQEVQAGDQIQFGSVVFRVQS